MIKIDPYCASGTTPRNVLGADYMRNGLEEKSYVRQISVNHTKTIKSDH